MLVLDVFKKFPQEAQLIGRLLAGYSTLEIDLMHCAQLPRNDFDTVLKAMFRTRGETQRIQVADSFARQSYRELGIGTEYETALGAMRHCLKIRNGYAHCVWWDDLSGKLAFANLEDIAESNDRQAGLRELQPSHIDVPLLESQANFYEFTAASFEWLLWEPRVRRKELTENPQPKPGHLAYPVLRIEAQ